MLAINYLNHRPVHVCPAAKGMVFKKFSSG